MAQYIDMTPTWEGLLPALRAITEYGTDAAIEVAWAELAKACRAADLWNAHCELEAEGGVPLFTSRRGTAATLT